MESALAWVGFFLGGWGTSFFGYAILQIAALLTLKRWFFVAALLPLGGMAYVAMATAEAYRQESNLWPILMIFASPVAMLAIAGVTIVGLRVQAHPQRVRLTYLSLGLVALVAAYFAYVFLAAG